MSVSDQPGLEAVEAAQAPAPEEARAFSLPVVCILAFAVGIVAAVGAVLFRYLISAAHNLFFFGTFSFLYDANNFDAPSPWGPFIILSPVIGGLIVVFLVKTFAPEAKGHGVPEVMYAIYHNNGNVRGIVAVVKSLASAISIGSGASVGREGPIIQIGASFGSTLARMLNLVRWQKITLLAAGAGAGIAATFNTPLGGVLFAIELLLPEVSNRTFLPVVVATATATTCRADCLRARSGFHRAVGDPARLSRDRPGATPGLCIAGGGGGCRLMGLHRHPRLVRGCLPETARQRVHPEHHRHGADRHPRLRLVLHHRKLSYRRRRLRHHPGHPQRRRPTAYCCSYSFCWARSWRPR